MSHIFGMQRYGTVMSLHAFFRLLKMEQSSVYLLSRTILLTAKLRSVVSIKLLWLHDHAFYKHFFVAQFCATKFLAVPNLLQTSFLWPNFRPPNWDIFGTQKTARSSLIKTIQTVFWHSYLR